jgi:hypothetical protein
MKDSAYLSSEQLARLLALPAPLWVASGVEAARAHSAANPGSAIVRYVQEGCLVFAVCAESALARVTGRTAAAGVA